jgi:hypothetical protein
MTPHWVDPVDECPPDPLSMLRRVAVLIETDLRSTLDANIECSAFEDTEGHVVLRAVWPPTIQQDLWPLPDWNEAITVARAIDRLQWSDFFDLCYEPWPVCLVHATSTHSMAAKAFGGTAWWICPETGKRTVPVGQLRAAERTV